MKSEKRYRLIISGGGTGGHVFPAIAIANAFKERYPDAEILFVGAVGKMEMTKVPEAGYRIVGLWISGLQRRLSWSNLLFPIKLLASLAKARSIIKNFAPHVVVGTGGYASGPVVMVATNRRIPAIIQEQNSFAGLTNRRLGDKVQRICVAYRGMEKFFPKEKVVITGNPVRKDILDLDPKRAMAIRHFGFEGNERTLLVLGGSLGAKTINESVLVGIDHLITSQVQVIWQTGKMYYESVKAQIKDKDLRRVRIWDFLMQMDLAYAAADVVVSRAGALAISELCLARRPAILVPSPNVAEDHQTRNASSLVQANAAILVTDREAREKLVPAALSLLRDTGRCKELSANIGQLGKPNAAHEIVNEIEKLIA